MTRDELAGFDGRDGRPAYVAVNGKVYDFTASRLWLQGDHQGEHQAGRDLTQELLQAPHVRAVVERFPVVGVLEEKAEAVNPAGHFRMVAILGAVVFVLIVLFLVKR